MNKRGGGTETMRRQPTCVNAEGSRWIPAMVAVRMRSRGDARTRSCPTKSGRGSEIQQASRRPTSSPRHPQGFPAIISENRPVSVPKTWPERLAKEGERRIGRCKMYNCDKGVGFLIDDRLDQVQQDVKIHWTDIFSDQEFKSLAKGKSSSTPQHNANGYSPLTRQPVISCSSRRLPVRLTDPSGKVSSPGESESSCATANPVSNVSRSAVTPRHAPMELTQRSLQPLKGSAPSAWAEKNEGQNAARSTTTSMTSRPVRRWTAANLIHPVGAPSIAIELLQSAILSYQLCGRSHSPPALSHSGMTPHSADSFNQFFQAPDSTRLCDSSSFHCHSIRCFQSYLANQGLPTSQEDESAGLPSFLAERQMLLQQQALLMSMYQNANQPIRLGHQCLQPLSFMNPMGAKSALGKAGEAQSYYEGLTHSPYAAGSSSAHLVFGDGQKRSCLLKPKKSNGREIACVPDPRTRSVSDPAALPGGKKLHALGHPPQTRHSSSPARFLTRGPTEASHLYNPEETRRCEDFTVSTWLERLRVAAAPRRLSLIKPAAPSSSVSSKPANQESKAPSLMPSMSYNNRLSFP
ncbi:hypothetical protein H4Q26_009386 [Puccinia striiformis f. sp. tritici PST-130]|nr:hypothetical protein H4Q26_009386 [Puccinia striiformis f. sp. tritici PST-130]